MAAILEKHVFRKGKLLAIEVVASDESDMGSNVDSGARWSCGQRLKYRHHQMQHLVIEQVAKEAQVSIPGPQAKFKMEQINR